MSDVTFKGSDVMVTNSTGGRKYRPNSADGVITFEMSKTVLWCNSSGGGLTFSNINNLSLINLTFLSCGNGMRVAALQLTNITTLYMSGVAILNSSLMGLYGYAVTGDSWIMNSFFVGGYSGIILQRSTVTIASVTFGDCNKGIQYGCNTSISCKFVFDQTGVDSTDTDDLPTTSDATLGVSASTKVTSESMLTVADSTFLYCRLVQKPCRTLAPLVNSGSPALALRSSHKQFFYKMPTQGAVLVSLIVGFCGRPINGQVDVGVGILYKLEDAQDVFLEGDTNTMNSIDHAALNGDAADYTQDTYTVFPGLPQGYVEFDMTEAARNWKDGAANNGLLVWATNENEAGTDLRFYSRRHIDATKRPFVNVLCAY
eukprot:Em0006g1324a